MWWWRVDLPYKQFTRCIYIYILVYQDATRPSTIFTFNCCPTFQQFLFNKTIISIFAELFIFSWIFKILQKSKIKLKQLFVILSIHSPSLESCEIWARLVQPFWRSIDANKQTDKHRAKYINICRYLINNAPFYILPNWTK